MKEVVAIGQNSRGAKTKRNVLGKDYYYFIREITAPSVIVECAFLDNKKDVQIIDTAAEQKAFGVAIAKGILKTLGVSYIEPTANSEKIYRVQVGAFSDKKNAEKLRNELIAKGFTGAYIKEGSA